MKKGSLLFKTATVILVVLIATLAGCNRGEEKTGFLVGFANSSVEHPWRIAIQNAILEEAEKYSDIEVIATEAGEDPIRQIHNVEDMLAKNIDLLLVCTVEGEPFKPAVEAVNRANVHLVPVDRAIVGDDYTAFVQQSNMDIGRRAADWIAEQMMDRYGSYSGSVVELQGVPGNIPAEHRRIGFHEQMRAQYSGIAIVAAQPTDYTRANALEVMENIIQGQAQIDAVYTHEDQIALGAIDALKEADRFEGVLVTGNGGSDEALASIKAGDMAACFTYSPIDFGRTGMSIAAKILYGESYERDTNLGGDIITGENVDYYLKQLSDTGEVYVSTLGN